MIILVPVIRGSYRSDTLINSITTKVQVLFWLSKTVTTNTMLLYEMSLFDKYYDNFLYIKSILHLVKSDSCVKCYTMFYHFYLSKLMYFLEE